MLKLLRTTLALIAAIALLSPVLPVAQAAFDEGADVLNACSGGRCGVPGAAGGFTGAKGPTQTVPRGSNYNVNILNPFVGVASPALNSISGSTAASTGQKFYEWAQEFVLENLKKQILDLMVDEIIDWVQGGESPKFVTDWTKFLEDAGNVALGDLAVRVGGAGLCEPFKDGILKGLLAPEPERFSGGNLYGSSITCTLDDIVDNIDGFYSDFKNGGWAAYTASWQTQNNPISVQIMTENSKYVSISKAIHAAELEAAAGNGFLSTKTCFESPTSTGPDLDGDKVKGDVASTCRITTPGAVIGDLVGKAVGADIDYIVNAEQLAAYMAAISDALWNRLIREGVGGLSSVSTDNAPGGGFISENANDCETLASSSPTLYSACIAYRNSNSDNLDITKGSLRASVEATQADLSELKTALTAWKVVADDLSTFITERSANRSAACISNALTPYFSNPTAAGVTSLANSIAAQLITVEMRIASLEVYRLQLLALPADTSWATFATLASEIQSKLAAFAVPEEAVETVRTNTADLKAASELNIQPDILRCF